MDTWYVRLGWTGPTTADHLGTIMDALTQHAPAGSMQQDGTGGDIRFVVMANTLRDAATAAFDTGTRSVLDAIPGAVLGTLSVQDDTAMNAELATPLYPDVIGYAEIADLAGVSRQRAQQFRDLPGFPTPVIKTGQGPLYHRGAIEVWLEQRNPRPGRPRTTA